MTEKSTELCAFRSQAIVKHQVPYWLQPHYLLMGASRREVQPLPLLPNLHYQDYILLSCFTQLLFLYKVKKAFAILKHEERHCPCLLRPGCSSWQVQTLERHQQTLVAGGGGQPRKCCPQVFFNNSAQLSWDLNYLGPSACSQQLGNTSIVPCSVSLLHL